MSVLQVFCHGNLARLQVKKKKSSTSKLCVLIEINMYINKKGVCESEPVTRPQAEADGGSKQGLATDVSP